MAYNDITHYDVKSKRFKPSTPGVWVDTQCFSKYHAPTVAQTLTEIESTENLLCSLTIVCFAQTVANNTLKNQLDHLATFKLAKKQCDLQTKTSPSLKVAKILLVISVNGLLTGTIQIRPSTTFGSPARQRNYHWTMSTNSFLCSISSFLTLRPTL
jgi:hypothetical protein